MAGSGIIMLIRGVVNGCVVTTQVTTQVYVYHHKRVMTDFKTRARPVKTPRLTTLEVEQYRHKILEAVRLKDHTTGFPDPDKGIQLPIDPVLCSIFQFAGTPSKDIECLYQGQSDYWICQLNVAVTGSLPVIVSPYNRPCYSPPSPAWTPDSPH